MYWRIHWAHFPFNHYYVFYHIHLIMRICQLGNLSHLQYDRTHVSYQKMYSDAFVCFPILQIHFVLIYPVCFYCFFPTVYITCTYSPLFPFTKLLLNPFVPNCFLHFFLLLLFTYYRFSLVFMKRPNNKLFLYKLVYLLLTWTRNVYRNCCILLKNCRLKKTHWIKEKEQEKKQKEQVTSW